MDGYINKVKSRSKKPEVKLKVDEAPKLGWGINTNLYISPYPIP